MSLELVFIKYSTYDTFLTVEESGKNQEFFEFRFDFCLFFRIFMTVLYHYVLSDYYYFLLMRLSLF